MFISSLALDLAADMKEARIRGFTDEEAIGYAIELELKRNPSRHGREYLDEYARRLVGELTSGLEAAREIAARARRF
jgi:hypothetical protein